MPSPSNAVLLERSLGSDRIHSAYLLTGAGSEPREAALRFARGTACKAAGERPCEHCDGCRRSLPGEEIALDGTGKKGPLYRHIGDHADLFWIERGSDDTRVRIGQVRALQQALRLRSSEGGRRTAVIADAEWLNQESQNALLRLLEEPPKDTTLVLVAASSAGMLATVRSRCQRVSFRTTDGLALDPDEAAELLARLESIGAASIPDLLDWAEEYRGARAVAAARVEKLLLAGASALRDRVAQRIRGIGGIGGIGGVDGLGAIDGLGGGSADVARELSAQRVLSACRKSLVQRNANPQMVAERALLALQSGVRG